MLTSIKMVKTSKSHYYNIRLVLFAGAVPPNKMLFEGTCNEESQCKLCTEITHYSAYIHDEKIVLNKSKLNYEHIPASLHNKSVQIVISITPPQSHVGSWSLRLTTLSRLSLLLGS